jgi:hypothetical protein
VDVADPRVARPDLLRPPVQAAFVGGVAASGRRAARGRRRESTSRSSRSRPR